MLPATCKMKRGPASVVYSSYKIEKVPALLQHVLNLLLGELSAGDLHLSGHLTGDNWIEISFSFAHQIRVEIN